MSNVTQHLVQNSEKYSHIISKTRRVSAWLLTVMSAVAILNIVSYDNMMLPLTPVVVTFVISAVLGLAFYFIKKSTPTMNAFA